MNPIDIAALFLVCAFGYKGYRTGLVSVVLGLTGGLLAFGMAAVLAPLLAPAVTPLVSDRLGIPSVFVRAVLVGAGFVRTFCHRETNFLTLVANCHLLHEESPGISRAWTSNLIDSRCLTLHFPFAA